MHLHIGCTLALLVGSSRALVTPGSSGRLLVCGGSGFLGREVCREAVVRVSHERAHQLETGQGGADQEQDWDAPLREVTLGDFKAAMSKMKASVNDNGSALRKVIEWNEKFGEVKRSETKAKRSSSLSMYV